jgi:phosphatidylglycerophosphatase A
VTGRDPRQLWRHPVHLVAFGFGTGLARHAPGTFGTLVGIPLVLLIQPLEPAAYLAALLGLFLIGIPICTRTANALQVHDHPAIVWDEVVGYGVTLYAAPTGWGWLVAGFVLFRFFDIIKPWPIRWIDRRVTGGFGIMLDDVLAGVGAWICLQALVWGWNLT